MGEAKRKQLQRVQSDLKSDGGGNAWGLHSCAVGPLGNRHPQRPIGFLSDS